MNGLKVNTERAPVGTIADIPIGLIRPFKNQPRKWFDPAKLKELSKSIAVQKQITPAWVMPIYGDPVYHYELIAGERRWRACELGGIATLRAEVRDPESAKKQFRDSVMENFGRLDCTAIESARAIDTMARMEFGENWQWNAEVEEILTTAFTRSRSWLQQHMSLLTKLPLEVQAMMEGSVPEDKQLKFGHAVALMNLKPEVQIQLAIKVSTSGWSFKRGLAYIRGHANSEGGSQKMTRGRHPNRNFNILSRFLMSLGEGAEGLLDMSYKTFKEMFSRRSPKELERVITLVKLRQEQLKSLEEVLVRVSESGREVHPNGFASSASPTR
jgi:ParB/RepB/Spo0J family partition protein